MGKVFFPLDEELGLLSGNLAPRQQEHLVHLACFMPFDKVAQMMEEMVSVQTNEETVRRLTQRMGACMEAAETATDGERESKEELPLQRCAFSTDGAMISLVHKQWVETLLTTVYNWLILVFGEPLKTMDRSDKLLQKESAGGSKECRPLHFLPYQKDWK